MSILKIRNEDGKMVDVPLIPGPVGPQGPQGTPGEKGETGADGKSAYTYAKEAGYLKSESEFATKLATENYSKNEVDNLVAEAVAKAEHLQRVIVQSSLSIDPNAEGAENFIYMVPKSNSLTEDHYDEFMVVEGKVEKVGDWAVDLSDYAKKNELPKTPEDIGAQPAGDYALRDEFPEVIDAALTQAKASGEFDGPQGEPGPKGDPGVTGPEGPAGVSPHIGENGNWWIGETDTGVKAEGEQGPKGDKGDQGEPGAKGDKGDQGEQGIQGEKGDKGDKGDDGITPLIRINATTNCWEISTNNGLTWTTTVPATGEKGEQGEKGDTGATGATGEKGDKGDKGETGATGPEGPQGPKGDQGIQGPIGPKGEDGKDGADGKDYVLTSADKKEIAEMAGAVTVPDYWQEHLASKIATIKALQDEGGKDCFSFAVITDMHYEQNLSKLAPKLAKIIADECGIKYVLILGDSGTRNGILYDREYIENEWDNIEKMIAPIRDRLLITDGNHDGSYGATDGDGDGVIDDVHGTGNSAFNFTPDQKHNLIKRKVGLLADVTFDENGCGYYADDKTAKVRYIVLSTHNNKYEENEDGSSKYSNMINFRYGQSQFDLVIKALSTLEEGWAVLVASHVPLDRSGELLPWGATEVSDNRLVSGEVECWVMADVLNAFVNRSTYKGGFTGTQGAVATYKNLVNKTEDLNGDGVADWLPGHRVSSSGIVAADDRDLTNYLGDGKTTVGDMTIYYKNATVSTERIAFYDANFNQVYLAYPTVFADREGFDGKATEGRLFIDKDKNESLYKTAVYVRLCLKPGDTAPIITLDQPIETSGNAYDAVSVDVDFTNAKGTLIGYFGGHVHKDGAWGNTYTWDGRLKQCDFWTITTRCDGRNENNSNLIAERIAGTVTEQSFDVFTVNKATHTIYATKIGAGTDREITYAASVNSHSAPSDLPRYWERHISDKVKSVRSQMDSIGKDGVSFIAVTDRHEGSNPGYTSALIRAIEEKTGLVVADLGDCASSGVHPSKADLLDTLDGVMDGYHGLNVLRHRGNHDASYGSLGGVNYAYNLSNKEAYSRIFSQLPKGCILGGDGQYYYYDDPHTKTRFICLNTIDHPHEENADGTAKYNGQNFYSIRQAQIDFVISALDVEDGWHIIVTCHVPPVSAYDAKFPTATYLRKLLAAYNSKTAISASYAGQFGGELQYTDLANHLSSEWQTGKRVNSSKNIVAVSDNNQIITNEMALGGNNQFHVKGLNIYDAQVGDANYCRIILVNSAHTIVTAQQLNVANFEPYYSVAEYDPAVAVVDVDGVMEKCASANIDISDVAFVRFGGYTTDPANVVITRDEEITESTTGWDALTIDADFTSYKGELVGMITGHTHRDLNYNSGNCVDINFPIVTVARDSILEDGNTATERIEGTTTEHAFDVFTVDFDSREIRTTRIGAGSDRKISYQ